MLESQLSYRILIALLIDVEHKQQGAVFEKTERVLITSDDKPQS